MDGEMMYFVKLDCNRRVAIRFQVEEEVSFPVPLEREKWVAAPTSDEDVREALGRLIGWKLAEFKSVRLNRPDVFSEIGKKIAEVTYE